MENDTPILGERFSRTGSIPGKINKIQKKAIDEIHERVKDGIWRQILYDCPICENHDFALLSESDKHGLPVNCVSCRNCGMVQLSPRWPEHAYNTFYKSLYRNLYQGLETEYDEEYLSYYFDLQKVQGRLVSETLERAGVHFSRGSSVLEVGCSAGGVLSPFHSQKHRCIGFDYDERYLAYGRRKGLDLRFGDLSSNELNENMDLIIYSHTLEHISNIHNEVYMIKSKLKADGKLFIEVPGLYETHKHYDYDFKRSIQSAHIYYFTANHLCAFLHQHGFETLYVDEHVRGVFRLKDSKNDSTKNNVPKEFDRVINYLTKTECVFQNNNKKLLIKRNTKKAFQFLLNKIGLELIARKIYRRYKNKPK